MSNPSPMRLLACLLLCVNSTFANPFLPAQNLKRSSDIKMLSTFIYASNGNIADGNRVVFDSEYSNDVDMYDAVKMTNPGENFGLKRGGFTLAVEARQPITDGDTLHYDMSNLITQVYSMKIEVQNLSNSVAMAELIDRFTGIRRFISLTNNSSFPVVVTNDPASRASNRFYLVFSAIAGPLPVKFLNTKAYQMNNKNIAVEWNTAEETNVEFYQVECSSDGIRFSTTGGMKKQVANTSYQYVHAPASVGNLFYRIKAIDLDGKVTYSSIMKVRTTVLSAQLFTAYPNPVKNEQLTVRLQNAGLGTWHLTMLNAFGQQVYAEQVKVVQPDQHFSFLTRNRLTPGIYTIKAINKEGQLFAQMITVQ